MTDELVLTADIHPLSSIAGLHNPEYELSMPIRLHLTPQEIAELNRPVNGQGGFQTLFRGLQARVQANGDIDLTDAQLGRILRHISYRPGGFETRLDLIFGRSIRAMLT